jgi:hypothetical protein
MADLRSDRSGTVGAQRRAVIVQRAITWTVPRTWEDIVEEIDVWESEVIYWEGNRSHFLISTEFEDLAADGKNGIIVTL